MLCPERTCYGQGKLTEDRIAKLNEAGFVWMTKVSWKTHFEELVEYKNTHGDCNVPCDSTDYAELGMWVK